MSKWEGHTNTRLEGCWHRVQNTTQKCAKVHTGRHRLGQAWAHGVGVEGRLGWGRVKCAGMGEQARQAAAKAQARHGKEENAVLPAK